MSDEKLLPLAHVVAVESYDPPRRLWHVPNTHPGYCPGCEAKVEKSKQASLEFNGHEWHPDCFRCSLCRQPFKEGCVPKDDLILHQECYKECFCERCAKCTQLIPPKKAVTALGRNFHAQCFTCTNCGDRDSTSTKFMTLFRFPYCNRCYEELSQHFPKCLVCSKVIGPSQGSREFFFQGKKHFVHYPECFKCTYCPAQLQLKSCCMYDNKLICKECYNVGVSKICAHCNEPIFDQGSKMGNIYWHTSHFVCANCKLALKPNSCVFSAGVLKCKSCSADDKGKCAGCNRAVVENGIRACGNLYHQECCKCQFCRKNVSGVGKHEKFFNIRGKPCCQKCYTRLKEEKKIDDKGRLRTGKGHKHKHGHKDESE